LKNLATLLEDYIIEYPHENAATNMLDFYNKDGNSFSKDNKKGHFTGSAWIVSPDRFMVLMTHHRKLNMWLQLGGHADGTEDLISVAIREAKEESGFNEFVLLSDRIFDLEIHDVPAIADEPVHYHYDVRFLLEADPKNNTIIISDESHDVRWIPLDKVVKLNPENSMQRMVKKTSALFR
jgi:8-oxo-dGTP pyrophosphatase MutT (NUDIX family)|tara:strand:+ start:248 stop:787 length:540 start_codon:yes stop_codon:yes gene_type:complete